MLTSNLKMTNRKLRQARKRKPELLEGTPLNPSIVPAMRYNRELDLLIGQMTDITLLAVKRMFYGETAEQYFAQDDKSIVAEAKQLSNELQKKFDALFNPRAIPIATQMVDSENKASELSVNNSLRQLTGALSLPTTGLKGEIGEVLKASVAENVGLIKSIPTKYLEAVNGAVLRSITTGNGLQDLVPFLANEKDITLRRAKMIANDQTRKAFNSISKGRLQAAGLVKFEWLHTGGSHAPRKDHIEMNGNIYRFDDLPVIDQKTGERGIPGQAVNCRCRMKPIIEFED